MPTQPWDTLLNTYAAGGKPQYAQAAARRIASAPRPQGSPQGPPGRAMDSGPPPRVGGKGGNVDNWISQALGVLKLDNSYAAGVRNMVMRESGGNPNAINNWDSNARKGTPSKGLIQTIDPTFQRWALPGYNKSPYDPISNLIAGIRYAQNRYGDNMLKAGGRKNSAGKYIGY